MSIEAVNEVLLVGRVSADAKEVPLPSGDVIVTFRLAVPRPPRPGARTMSDAIDCVVWRSGPRRAAMGWQVGDVVRVSGALRRRFWRGPVGPASRFELEVDQARRLERAS